MLPITSPLDRFFRPLDLGDPALSDAVERAARALDLAHGSAVGAVAVAALGVDEVAAEMAPAEAARLLHLAARRLARADAEAAWTGLLLAPSAATAGWPAEPMLAWHLGADDGRRIATSAGASDASPLPGFARLFAVPAPVPERIDPALASPAVCALLAGLLCGVSERLAEEAHAYARARHSGGKPIDQHQAVALRLADIDMSLEALLLSAAVIFEPMLADEAMEASEPALLADLAAAIARDAVQVAAAHGYVDGLNFKRLFSQSRTLASMLLLMDASARSPGRARRMRGSTRVH
jgi:hypothetical protein